MKRQKEEITIEKIKLANKLITRHIRHPYTMEMVETCQNYDEDLGDYVYKDVLTKIFRGHRALDKQDTRLSIKSYKKTSYKLNYYKSITPKYVQQFVCKEKVTLRLVHYVLYKLIANRTFSAMYCKDIDGIVVHINPSWGGIRGLQYLRDPDNYMWSRLEFLRDDYIFVKNYLKSNKIENSNS